MTRNQHAEALTIAKRLWDTHQELFAPGKRTAWHDAEPHARTATLTLALMQLETMAEPASAGSLTNS